jgi:hypothetical protein
MDRCAIVSGGIPPPQGLYPSTRLSFGHGVIGRQRRVHSHLHGRPYPRQRQLTQLPVAVTVRGTTGACQAGEALEAKGRTPEAVLSAAENLRTPSRCMTSRLSGRRTVADVWRSAPPRLARIGRVESKSGMSATPRRGVWRCHSPACRGPSRRVSIAGAGLPTVQPPSFRPGRTSAIVSRLLEAIRQPSIFVSRRTRRSWS